jgi:hypothetical protein
MPYFANRPAFPGTKMKMRTIYGGCFFMNNKYFAVLPLNLVYEEKYSELSSKAVLLYSLFLNRTKFSLQNKKFKDDNGVFIYYSTEQISKHLHCGISSAKVTLSELEQAGLIRKEYQQNGLPLKIYVNDVFGVHNRTYKKDKPAPDTNKTYKSPAPHKDKDVSFDTDKLDEMVHNHLFTFSEKKKKRKPN